MSEASPLVTIVTPIFNPPPEEFRLCVASVLEQTLSSWQWCITDDGSADEIPAEILRMLEDPRISFARLPSNQGIAAATNESIRRANGEFVAFLDQDDELARVALEVFSRFESANPQTDVFYSDEDKIDLNGDHFDAFRKSDWSPERLRHQNYFNHLTVIRKAVIEECEFLRSEFDGSQDYDLVLRATERARGIRHIPEILYHWRAVPSSVASDPRSKPKAHEAGARAVAEHVQRVGIDATVTLNENTLYVDVKRRLRSQPKVSILIPSRGSSSRVNGTKIVLIENCVESILAKSTYSNYEIVVILDDSSPISTREFLMNRDEQRLKVVEFTGEFNFSTKINTGAVHSSGEVLLLLNDDTQVITPNWMEEMIVHLEEPDVAMSAPLLLLEDGLIQSAGHFFRNGAHHVAPGRHPKWTGYRGILTFESERSGVTFACVALKRDVFNLVGGMSEAFPRSFNDVDFCAKVRSFGYRIIWTPKACLYHFESATRDPTVAASEVEQLYRRWGKLMMSADEYLTDIV